MNPLPPSRSPILVTGAHRTGTTWVGKMLAASREAAYISEPLNVWHRAGVFSAPIRYWYTYICSENEAQYLTAFKKLLAFQYHVWDELKSLRSRKDIMRMGRDWSIFLRGRLFELRPLLKDPFAIFSAGWFAERLGCQVVITVRHPAAFASSLKRLKWPFDFTDLLAQPLLMRDHLEPYREAMETTPAHDIIGQSSLLWKMIYQRAADCYQNRRGFYFVRQEELSIHPIEGFQGLYRSLGLKFTPRSEKAIRNSTSASNPKEGSGQAIHTVKLDSRATLARWKHRLTPEEVRRVRAITEEVAARYYSEDIWE